MTGGRPPGKPRGPSRPRAFARPVGRPRRDSRSTVSSLDTNPIKFSPESSILKPTKTSESDDWPVVVLQDAVVYRKTRDGQLIVANACNVNLEGPFVVRGKLDVDLHENGHLLRSRSDKSAYIEIPSSECYSIGFGPWPVVWVGGEAGWYELHPNSEYESMYETVCEGITLYYKIWDVYDAQKEKLVKSKRHKALQMNIDQLLFKYAVCVGDGITLDEAKERCQKHAPFLLAHFEKECDFNWNPTSFKKWLTMTNEDLVKDLEAKSKRPLPFPSKEGPKHSAAELAEELQKPLGELPLRAPTAPETARSMRSKFRVARQGGDNELEMVDAPAAAASHVKTSVLPSVAQVQTTATASLSVRGVGDAGSTAEAPPENPVTVLLELLEEILDGEGGDITRLGRGKVHTYIRDRLCMTHYRAAKEMTHFYAEPLLASLSSKFHGSSFFLWLKDVAKEPCKSRYFAREDMPSKSVRRTRRNTPVIIRTHDQGGSSPPRGAGKCYPPTTFTPRPAALRPGKIAKRPARCDDENFGHERAPKTARTSQGISDEERDSEEDVDCTGAAAKHTANGTALLGISATTLPKETVRIVVRGERIPSMSPSGPNGTWKCEEDGCNYVVRSAEQQYGKELIEKHFQYHLSLSHSEKIHLALSEGSRGHLPIQYAYNPLFPLRTKAVQLNLDHSGERLMAAPL